MEDTSGSSLSSNESDGSNPFSSTVEEMLISSKNRRKMRKSELERRKTHGNNAPNNQITDPEQQILPDEEIDIDLKSLSLKGAVDELDNRPKNGAIYDEVSAIWTTVNERLKFLSKNDGKLTIDEAIEIYDASILLKLLRKHEDEIESAGKMAHNGVLLMLQGQMLKKKGRQLLAQSKSKLQNADL